MDRWKIPVRKNHVPVYRFSKYRRTGTKSTGIPTLRYCTREGGVEHWDEHDDTVRKRKHEPVTNQDLRRRMVAGLKPVDAVVVGNPPDVPIFDILPDVQPDVIALGYDQEHAEDNIRKALHERGHGSIEVVRVEGLSDDLDGTRKIIARILERAEKKEA